MIQGLDFHYQGEQDFLQMYRFRLQCRMEKVPGRIIIRNHIYHINSEGRFVGEEPEVQNEFHKMLASLVSPKKES